MLFRSEIMSILTKGKHTSKGVDSAEEKVVKDMAKEVSDKSQTVSDKIKVMLVALGALGTLLFSQGSKASTTSQLLPPSGVGASSDAVENILSTIRFKESGSAAGNYSIPHPVGMPTQSASGAYAFTDEAWQSLTKK